MTEEKAQWKAKYRLEKRVGGVSDYASEEEFLRNVEPYDVIEGEDNCLLATGIAEMWDLITSETLGATFDNAAATIGVGGDNTAASSTQTDLQSSTSTYYIPMTTGWPTSTGAQAEFKGSADTESANFAWEEWVVKHSTSGVCLNRKVDSLGTKASGTTWTLTVTITLS